MVKEYYLSRWMNPIPAGLIVYKHYPKTLCYRQVGTLNCEKVRKVDFHLQLLQMKGESNAC